MYVALAYHSERPARLCMFDLGQSLIFCVRKLSHFVPDGDVWLLVLIFSHVHSSLMHVALAYHSERPARLCMTNSDILFSQNVRKLSHLFLAGTSGNSS